MMIEEVQRFRNLYSQICLPDMCTTPKKLWSLFLIDILI